MPSKTASHFAEPSPRAQLAPRRLRLVGPVDLGPRATAREDLLEDRHVALDLPEPIAADLGLALRLCLEERLIAHSGKRRDDQVEVEPVGQAILWLERKRRADEAGRGKYRNALGVGREP